MLARFLSNTLPRLRPVLATLALSVFALLCCMMCTETAADEPAATQEQLDFFEAKIRPVLVKHCYECHSTDAETIDGELLLDSRAGVAKGGEHGAVVDLKEPQKSRLLVALGYADDELQMPPDDKLPDDVIADFEKWIQLGAPDPRDGQIVTPHQIILKRAKDHWAFVPPTKPDLPEVGDKDWSRQPLDRFVLASYERAKDATTALPDATADALIRRVYYDLTGLPPSYDQVTSFTEDPSDDAYAAVVDELLASPQFGERWARHWLDLARFADTKGYVFTASREYPHAYVYRDWVVDAFNRDLPIDDFLALQIAADQLVDEDQPKEEQRKDLAALGYVTLGRRFINNKHDIIDDRIDVVFRGMMGLTVSCARCHDHKYDPISAKDYYGIYGVFNSSKEQKDDDLPVRLVDEDKPRDAKVFVRGNSGNQGEPAPRQFPAFFSGEQKPFSIGSGRLELAQAIASRDNPLTARVFVNRVWGHLFGEPLVGTTSDFGLRSDEPALPKLLDHLAVEFVEDHWSLKRLVRRIVLSSAYRQASAPDGRGSLVRRRRRDFESMRDSLLQVAGHLDTKTVGGKTFKIEATPSSNRRTLYARIERQNLPGLFRTFDFANPDAHSPHRLKTTVPQQALFLMNSPFMMEMAKRTAARADDKTPANQICDIYHVVYSRDATVSEIAMGEQFLTAPEFAEQSAPTSLWQFGYGDVVTSKTNRKKPHVSFTPFEHFVDDQWQRETKFPGEKYGHAFLGSDRGHPGRDHGVIRRWTAPSGGNLRILGRLKHSDIDETHGDGVRIWIVSNRQGILGEWRAKNGKVAANVYSVSIEPNEIIDFVVGPGESDSYDGFVWNPTLRLKPVNNTSKENDTSRRAGRSWQTKDGFHGPLLGLSRREAYVQALLLTNEFMFVD